MKKFKGLGRMVILIFLIACVAQKQAISAPLCQRILTDRTLLETSLRENLLKSQSIIELEHLNIQSREGLFTKQIPSVEHLINSYIFYVRTLKIEQKMKQLGVDLTAIQQNIVGTIDRSVIAIIEKQLAMKYGPHWKIILNLN